MFLGISAFSEQIWSPIFCINWTLVTTKFLSFVFYAFRHYETVFIQIQDSSIFEWIVQKVCRKAGWNKKFPRSRIQVSIRKLVRHVKWRKDHNSIYNLMVFNGSSTQAFSIITKFKCFFGRWKTYWYGTTVKIHYIV